MKTNTSNAKVIEEINLNVANDNGRKHLLNSLFMGRIFLINPKFQYKFMASVMLVAVFTIGIVYFANYYFFENLIMKGEMLQLPQDHAFFILIKEQREMMSGIFLIVCLTLTLGIGLWGLLFSHRIAGPLYRLNRQFQEASQGKADLQNLKFRKNDFFPELPETINEYFRSKHIQ